MAGTKENVMLRQSYHACPADAHKKIHEKTGDVKLLSANFSQDAHRKAIFLITLYELFAISYHHK